MEFIGLGDLHFDKLNNLVPEASDKIARSLHRVFGYAMNHGVEHVFFYGDLCEFPRMTYEAQVAFMKVLLDTKYRDLKFHIILG